MAITALAPWFIPTIFTNAGVPLAGGLIYTYAAGTTTPLATYSDENVSVPISNPIVLNASGRPQASATDPTEVNIYLSAGSYKFVVKTSAGVTLKTADHVEANASILYVDAAIAAGQTSPTITTPTIIHPVISWTYATVQAVGFTAAVGTIYPCSGTFSITLPTVVGNDGRQIWIVNRGTGTLTLSAHAGQTILGASTYAFAFGQYSSLSVIADATNLLWDIF